MANTYDDVTYPDLHMGPGLQIPPDPSTYGEVSYPDLKDVLIYIEKYDPEFFAPAPSAPPLNENEKLELLQKIPIEELARDYPELYPNFGKPEFNPVQPKFDIYEAYEQEKKLADDVAARAKELLKEQAEKARSALHKHKQEMLDARKKIADLNSAIEQITKEKKELEFNFKVSDHLAKSEEKIIKDHMLKIEELTEKLGQKHAEALALHHKVAEIQAQTRKDIATEQAVILKQSNLLRRHEQDLVEAGEIEKGLQKEIEALKKDQSLNSSEKDKLISSLRENIKTLEEDKKGIQQEISKAKTALQEEKNQAKKAVDDLTQDYKALIDGLKQEMEKDRKTLKDEYERLVRAVKQNLAGQKKEIDRLVSKYNIPRDQFTREYPYLNMNFDVFTHNYPSPVLSNSDLDFLDAHYFGGPTPLTPIEPKTNLNTKSHFNLTTDTSFFNLPGAPGKKNELAVNSKLLDMLDRADYPKSLPDFALPETHSHIPNAPVFPHHLFPAKKTPTFPSWLFAPNPNVKHNILVRPVGIHASMADNQKNFTGDQVLLLNTSEAELENLNSSALKSLFDAAGLQLTARLRNLPNDKNGKKLLISEFKKQQKLAFEKYPAIKGQTGPVATTRPSNRSWESRLKKKREEDSFYEGLLKDDISELGRAYGRAVNANDAETASLIFNEKKAAEQELNKLVEADRKRGIAAIKKNKGSKTKYPNAIGEVVFDRKKGKWTPHPKPGDWSWSSDGKKKVFWVRKENGDMVLDSGDDDIVHYISKKTGKTYADDSYHSDDDDVPMKKVRFASDAFSDDEDDDEVEFSDDEIGESISTRPKAKFRGSWNKRRVSAKSKKALKRGGPIRGKKKKAAKPKARRYAVKGKKAIKLEDLEVDDGYMPLKSAIGKKTKGKKAPTKKGRKPDPRLVKNSDGLRDIHVNAEDLMYPAAKLMAFEAKRAGSLKDVYNHQIKSEYADNYSAMPGRNKFATKDHNMLPIKTIHKLLADRGYDVKKLEESFTETQGYKPKKQDWVDAFEAEYGQGAVIDVNYRHTQNARKKVKLDPRLEQHSGGYNILNVKAKELTYPATKLLAFQAKKQGSKIALKGKNRHHLKKDTYASRYSKLPVGEKFATHDIGMLPIPTLKKILEEEAGFDVKEYEKNFTDSMGYKPTRDDWVECFDREVGSDPVIDVNYRHAQNSRFVFDENGRAEMLEIDRDVHNAKEELITTASVSANGKTVDGLRCLFPDSGAVVNEISFNVAKKLGLYKKEPHGKKVIIQATGHAYECVPTEITLTVDPDEIRHMTDEKLPAEINSVSRKIRVYYPVKDYNHDTDWDVLLGTEGAIAFNLVLRFK